MIIQFKKKNSIVFLFELSNRNVFENLVEYTKRTKCSTFSRSQSLELKIKELEDNYSLNSHIMDDKLWYIDLE